MSCPLIRTNFLSLSFVWFIYVFHFKSSVFSILCSTTIIKLTTTKFYRSSYFSYVIKRTHGFAISGKYLPKFLKFRRSRGSVNESGCRNSLYHHTHNLPPHLRGTFTKRESPKIRFWTWLREWIPDHLLWRSIIFALQRKGEKLIPRIASWNYFPRKDGIALWIDELSSYIRNYFLSWFVAWFWFCISFNASVYTFFSTCPADNICLRACFRIKKNVN